MKKNDYELDRSHSSDVNFNYLPWREGESENLKN